MTTIKIEETFEFRVTDAEGPWGDLRIKAGSEEDAQQKCRRWLRRNEVEPNGSLLPEFTLTRIQTTP